MQFDDETVDKARKPIVNSKGISKDPSFTTFKLKLFAAPERLRPGTFAECATDIIDGQKVILHHTLFQSGANLYKVVGVTKSHNLAIHVITGYKNAIWDSVIYSLVSGVF